MLDDALWMSGMGCAILAHERATLDKIFDIPRRAFENLPDAIKPKTRADSARELRFTERYDGMKLDSNIYVALKVRGGTVQRLHITESAYVKDRQELDAGSKQAVPIEGWITEETTGNGFNTFYDAYMEAYNNPNPTDLDYKTYFYAWHEHPEYTLDGTLPNKTGKELEMIEKYKLTDGQLLWRRWKMNELKRSNRDTGLSGDQLFKQEYPSSMLEAFQSGAGNVFDSEILEKIDPVEPMDKESVLQGVKPDDQSKWDALLKKELKIWELPEEGKKYNIGIDPSDGTGADYSVIDVWTDTDQVAQLKIKENPKEVARLGCEIGYLYNTAYMGVENNKLSTILYVANEFKYPHFHYERVVDEKTGKKKKKIGWNTNSKTRDLMIDDFLILFEDEELNIRSGLTISEMFTFVTKENGKREHANGKHDDALFAGFIAIQMRKYNRPRGRAFANKPW